MKRPRSSGSTEAVSRVSAVASTEQQTAATAKLEEEEEIPEADEPGSSQDSGEITYSKKRFRYQEKKFAGLGWEKSLINLGQFGHKKYKVYTNRQGKPLSIRKFLHGSIDRPAYRRLDDDNGILKIRGKSGGSWMKTVLVIVSVSTLAGGIIQALHRPHGDLERISSVKDMIHDKVGGISELLTKAEFTRGVLMGLLVEVGNFLNDSALAQVTISEIQEQRLAEGIWKFIGREASACENPGVHQILMMCIHFIDDLVSSGGESRSNAGVIGKVAQRCIEVEMINSALFEFLTTAAVTGDGSRWMSGLAGSLVKPLIAEGFGPWTFSAMKFFAFWSEMGRIFGRDQDEVCRFVEMAVGRQDSWKREHVSMFCMLSKNLRCPFLASMDVEKYHRRDECTEIFEALKDLRKPEIRGEANL
jgi:hypothetical protein